MLTGSQAMDAQEEYAPLPVAEAAMELLKWEQSQNVGYCDEVPTDVVSASVSEKRSCFSDTNSDYPATAERLASNQSSLLPTDPAARKSIPLCTGVLDYFPDALAAVAMCSKDGNDQHNPGEPLHWAREKSSDHADCIARHLVDRGKMDERGIRHSARMAWRALALLQLEIENSRST